MQESEFTGCVNKVQGKAAERAKKHTPLKALKYQASQKRTEQKNIAPSQVRLEKKGARKNHRAAYVDAPYCFL
jgi:hypothetical protein